jgi:hypothetical protein
VVAGMPVAPRGEIFDAIDAVAREAAQIQRLPPEGGSHVTLSVASAFRRNNTAVPHMTEAWYCCAEPTSAKAMVDRPASAEASASATAPADGPAGSSVPAETCGSAKATAEGTAARPGPDIASYV